MIIFFLLRSENSIKKVFSLIVTIKFSSIVSIIDLILSLGIRSLFWKEIFLSLTLSFLYPILDFLKTDLISDNNISNFSEKTMSISALSNRYDPPFRSSPRLIDLPGKKLKEVFFTELFKKLGIA